MAISTRKSLWDQIKDLLSPPSQAINQSQIQSTAQQKQNQIKDYTDLYYANPYTQQSISKPAPTGDVNISVSSPVSYGISNPFETIKKEKQFQFSLNQDNSNQPIIPSQPDYSNSFLTNFNQEAQNQPPNFLTPISKAYNVINQRTTDLGKQFEQKTPSEKWQDIGNFLKHNVQQTAQSIIKFAYSLGPEVQNIIQTGESSNLNVPKILQPILGTDKITSYQQDVQNNLNLIRRQNPNEPYALSVIKAAAYPVIDLLINAYFIGHSLEQGAKFLTSLGPDEEQVTAWATLGRPETLKEAQANYYDLIHQYKQQQLLGGPQAAIINNAYNVIKTKGIPDVHTITGVVSKIGQALLSSPSKTGEILTSPITGVPKVAQTRLLPSRAGYIPEQPFQPSETPPLVPVGLSTQPISTSPEQPNLPNEIANLIGKTEPNGATIKQIVPVSNGYEATIVTPKGNEFKTIINSANLNNLIQTYNPSPTTKIDSIKSQLRNLYYQLDATDNPIEQAVIQTKINRLQKQIDELTSTPTVSQTIQEAKPESKTGETTIQQEQKLTAENKSLESAPEKETNPTPTTAPETKEEFAETPISQSETISETPLNEQNSPLEPSNTQESINIPTENTSSQMQNLDGKNISQHSLKLGELINEPGLTYTPINEKEELNKVKNWINSNPNAIEDITRNNIPSNLNRGSLITYVFQSKNPELISAVYNNIDISKQITEAAQTLTTIDYGKDSVVNTVKIYTDIKAKKIKNVQKIYDLKNNKEVYDKIKEFSNDLSDKVRYTIQKVAEQSVPQLEEILNKEGINIDSLISMPSDERIKLFAKYFSADAYKVNQSFENAVLSKKSIENGVIQAVKQWAKRQKLPTSTQEIIDTATQLFNNSKIDKAFSPELSSVVNHIVNKAVGIYLSPEEAGQLQTYINQASQDLQKFDYEKGEWKTPEDGIKFGTDYYKLQSYIRDLSEVNNPSELARQMMTELKIAREKGLVNFIGKINELTLKNLNDIFTSIVANGDMSVIGRQMRNLIFTHPGIWFKVVGANIQALKIDQKQFLESVYIKLYSDPNFVAGRLNNLIPHTFEEMPSVKFLEWAAQQKVGLPIKILMKTAAAFEGGYIRGLQLYADYVYNAAKFMGLNIDDKKVIKDVQDYVKTFLGQSPLGNSKFWQAYSLPAWAAGLTKSHLLTGYSYLFGGAPESVRGLAAKEAWMVRLGSFALMLLFAYIYGKKRIQWDPRASTFSGIQLSPTKDDYIILNPYSAEDVLLARMLLHIYNKMNPNRTIPNFVSSVTGKEYNTANAGYGEPNMWDVIIDFAEGKSKPIVGLFIDFLKNEAFGGKQLTAGEAAKRVSVPISGQNALDVFMNTEADRKAYGIITNLADIFGINNTHLIRSVPWDYNFTKEVYRLAEKYPNIATAYHLGFLQANKMLTAQENQEIFDYIVKVVNEEGVSFIQSQTYQQLSDDIKAKAIAKSLDGIREDAYKRLMYNKIVNAPPQQLENIVLHFYKAGLFTSNRLKDMWNSFTPEMRDKILDIVNNKILPLEKKS